MPTTFSTIESVRKELHEAQMRWTQLYEEEKKLDNQLIDWSLKINELHEELDRMEHKDRNRDPLDRN